MTGPEPTTCRESTGSRRGLGVTSRPIDKVLTEVVYEVREKENPDTLIFNVSTREWCVVF